MNLKTVRTILLWFFILCMVGTAAYVAFSASSNFNMTVMVLIVVIGVAAIIAYGILGVMFNNQRKTALQQMALERGLTYDAQMSDLSMLLGAVSFDQTSTGHYHRVRNTLSGQWQGLAVKVFDLYYMTGTGKNQSAHQFTGVALAGGELNTPDFSVKPENVFTKITNALGRKEIDFEEDPDFSKQFQLLCADEAGARRLFSPIVREWFKHHRGISAEMRSNLLLFFRPEHVLQPEEILQMLEEGAVLVSQLRRFM